MVHKGSVFLPEGMKVVVAWLQRWGWRFSGLCGWPRCSFHTTNAFPAFSRTSWTPETRGSSYQACWSRVDYCLNTLVHVFPPAARRLRAAPSFLRAGPRADGAERDSSEERPSQRGRGAGSAPRQRGFTHTPTHRDTRTHGHTHIVVQSWRWLRKQRAELSQWLHGPCLDELTSRVGLSLLSMQEISSLHYLRFPNIWCHEHYLREVFFSLCSQGEYPFVSKSPSLFCTFVINTAALVMVLVIFYFI